MMEQAHDPEQKIAERYFLGELTDAEAEAFEAHYFECPGCAEYVVEEQMLLDSGRAVAREQYVAAAAVAPAPVVDLNERRNRRRQWVPAAAAAMLVIALGTPLWIRGTAETDELQLISRIETVEFAGTRDEAPAMKSFPEGEPFLFDVRVTPPPAGATVELSVMDVTENKVIRRPKPVAEEQLGAPVFMQLTLPAGSYAVVIENVQGGRRTEIGAERFEVRRRK